MKYIKKWLHTYSLFLTFIIVVFLLLEWLVRAEIVPSFIIPAPTSVIVMIIENWRPLIMEHLSATMLEFLIGFTISVIGGIALAVSMFFSKVVEKMMYPTVVISQMIPIVALSPIFVLWFGYSIWSKVAVTVLMSFFSIVVGTYDGLKSSDKEYMRVIAFNGGHSLSYFYEIANSNGASILFLRIEASDCLCVSRSNNWRMARCK